VNDYVDSQIKAGKTPKERSLKTIMATCLAMKDQTCETHAFERLVLYYPKGDYWANLINSLFTSDDYKVGFAALAALPFGRRRQRAEEPGRLHRDGAA